jgi:hypothetical protein
VSCCTVIGFLYSLKSTPRIFVDVDGIGMEGLRTAAEAFVASSDIVLSSSVPVPPLPGCSMPFDMNPLDIALDIVATKFCRIKDFQRPLTLVNFPICLAH